MVCAVVHIYQPHPARLAGYCCKFVCRSLTEPAVLDSALQVADRLEKAVNKALDDGYRTKDIWTEGHKLLKCSEMGEVLTNSVA